MKDKKKGKAKGLSRYIIVLKDVSEAARSASNMTVFELRREYSIYSFSCVEHKTCLYKFSDFISTMQSVMGLPVSRVPASSSPVDLS
jgi:hypothetical protein